jgi:hypothetical protein
MPDGGARNESVTGAVRGAIARSLHFTDEIVTAVR